MTFGDKLNAQRDDDPPTDDLLYDAWVLLANGAYWDHTDPKNAMRHRVREPGNAQLYKRRSATVEPVIAHLKDQTRLRRFARRGLQAATAELNLAAAVVNLTRLHNAASAPG